MAVYESIDSRGPGKPYSARNVENQEVDQPSPALAGMLGELCLVEDLLGGTLAMREAGREHLPQHEYESNQAYGRRVKSTYLDEYTLRTLNTLIGKAFKEPPAPNADMHEQLVEFLDDVDGAGTGLVPFARQWFREGVKGAVAYVLVDTPAQVEGEPATKADEQKATWRLIPTRDMLDYREGPTPQGIKPTYVRFKDDVVEPDGRFGTKVTKRRKIITPDGWEVWTFTTGPRGGQPKWVKTDEGVLENDFVYVVPFYTDKSGPGEGRSPLAGLAHLNKRHWQSTSDQVNILTVCRFPIFAGSGIPDDPAPQVEDITGQTPGATAVIGPNKFLSTSEPQGKFYWVEHTGAAVASGKTELDDLKLAMSAYGSQFLEKGAVGPETASGRILDEAESVSPLQSWGIDFRDCLMLACYYTAELAGIGELDAKAYAIDFEVDAEAGQNDQQDLDTLNKARDRKDISREAYLQELLLRGVIKNDKFDPEEDAQAIKDEPPPPGTGLDGMATGLAGAKGAPKPAPKPAPKAPPAQME